MRNKQCTMSELNIDMFHDVMGLSKSIDFTDVYEEAITTSRKNGVTCPIIIVSDKMTTVKYALVENRWTINPILFLAADLSINRMIKYTAKALTNKSKTPLQYDAMSLSMLAFEYFTHEPIDMANIYGQAVVLSKELKIPCPLVFPFSTVDLHALGGTANINGEVRYVFINTAIKSERSNESILAHEMRHVWQITRHEFNSNTFTGFTGALSSKTEYMSYLFSPPELDAEAYSYAWCIKNNQDFGVFCKDPIYCNALEEKAFQLLRTMR